MLFELILSLSLLSIAVKAYETVNVLQPLDLAAQFPSGIDHKPAMFGIPSYTASVTGPLIYATPGDTDGCDPLDPTDWPEGTKIILVDRGNCTFVDKVRNIQNAGGTAAIIADNIAETVLPYMADDGTGADITVPSVLISRADGDTLETYVGSSDVMLQMQWSIPHPDGRVEWSLWTSSNDAYSREFKTVFGAVSTDLGSKAMFTPRYYILDGSDYGCDTAGFPCGNQCTADGRYCAIDPDGHTSEGISGLDVVEENLRQMCLFNHVNSTGQQELYWDYVSKFIFECCNPDDMISAECNPDNWNSECSYGILNELDLDANVIQQCEATDMVELFDAEIYLREISGIFFIPTMIINNSPYRGALVCNDPLNAFTCGPLEAICAGYATGTLPDTCMGDVSCTYGVFQDDCGVCGADGRVDACGLCLSPSSGHFNESCAGCDGVPLSGLATDPCGVCGGDGSFDLCGRCYEASDDRRVDDSSANCDQSGAGEIIFSDNSTLYGIFAGILILIFGGVWFYTKRQRAHLERIDAVLQSYLPLQEANDSRAGGPGVAMSRPGTSINDDFDIM